eukprot:TRINITY_DN2791_c0_g2_i1.p1 TRINITY_DN2791_c0_g2~~TRINITY_DN2791_c0_g2_i1.p1  ORF type:complete len:429 (-),score=73.54 TRINITY_DN2791_c0_g2_i1:121-1407(-)
MQRLRESIELAACSQRLTASHRARRSSLDSSAFSIPKPYVPPSTLGLALRQRRKAKSVIEHVTTKPVGNFRRRSISEYVPSGGAEGEAGSPKKDAPKLKRRMSLRDRRASLDCGIARTAPSIGTPASANRPSSRQAGSRTSPGEDPSKVKQPLSPDNKEKKRKARKRLSLQAEDLVPSRFHLMAGMAPAQRIAAMIEQQRQGQLGVTRGGELKQQAVAQMHAMFLKYEGAEDGEVKREQFVNTMSKQFPMLADHAGGMFDSLDRDGSGTLCFTEFIGMVCPWASQQCVKAAVEEYMKEGYQETMIAMDIPGFITSHLKMDMEYENQKILERRGEVDPQERDELEEMFERLSNGSGVVAAASLEKYCQGFELDRCFDATQLEAGLDKEQFVELLATHYSASNLNATRVAHALRSGGGVPDRVRSFASLK